MINFLYFKAVQRLQPQLSQPQLSQHHVEQGGVWSRGFRRRAEKVRLYSGALFVLIAAPCFAAEQQSTAPSGGGYSSDFGSDFGVGVGQAGVREPIAVVGFSGQSPRGALPWIGLRFADLMSQRLMPLTGNAPSTPSLTQFMASRGLRAQDIVCPPNANTTAISVLKNDVAWRKRARLVLMGDVTLSGIDAAVAAPQAASFTGENATLTVRFRVVRTRDAALSPIITVIAPAREWGQLPARSALALLDAMRIKLSEDERASLLRAASPLTPNVSSARLRAEQQLGEGVAAALDSRVLTGKSNWRAAVTRGDAALKLLRPLQQNAPGGDAGQIAASAKNWMLYAATTTTSARARLRSTRK